MRLLGRLWSLQANSNLHISLLLGFHIIAFEPGSFTKIIFFKIELLQQETCWYRYYLLVIERHSYITSTVVTLTECTWRRLIA